MSISDKMIYLRTHSKLSTEELSELSGVPIGTLNKLFNGETKNPTGKTASKIATALGVTAEYLLNDDIPIDLDTKKSPTPEESEARDNITPISKAFDKQTRQHIEKYTALDSYGKKAVDWLTDNEFDRVTHQNELGQNIETVDMMIPYEPVSAGLGASLNGDGVYKHTTVLSNTYTRKADFMLRVEGQSMEPKYYDGDLILVQEQDDVDFGEIGVWVVNGKGYVKQKDDDYLRSLNPKYPDVHFSEWDEYRCVGKVIGTLDPDWIVKN